MRLCSKQHLLIHAITGGVGLVALELALHSAAIIFSSVGRPSKVSHVRLLGVAAAASSRDALTFLFGAATSIVGRRLHSVLSALSKAFVPASLALVSLESCYLEVGKNNIWSEARMAAAAPCSPFHLIAAGYQSAEWTHHRLAELAVRAGAEVHPLPLATFAFETPEMIRAFNGVYAESLEPQILGCRCLMFALRFAVAELRRGDHIGRYVAIVAHHVRCGAVLQLDGIATCRMSGRNLRRASLFEDTTAAILQLDDAEYFNTFSNELGEDVRRAVQHICYQPSVEAVILQPATPHTVHTALSGGR